VAEVRRLLWACLPPRLFVLAWSYWRRHHQAVAQHHHYQRRLNLMTQLQL
jgi:hypothetical protein